MTIGMDVSGFQTTEEDCGTGYLTFEWMLSLKLELPAQNPFCCSLFPQWLTEWQHPTELSCVPKAIVPSPPLKSNLQTLPEFTLIPMEVVVSGQCQLGDVPKPFAFKVKKKNGLPLKAGKPCNDLFKHCREKKSTCCVLNNIPSPPSLSSLTPGYKSNSTICKSK